MMISESILGSYLVLLASSPDGKICVGHCLDVCDFGRVESHIFLSDYSAKVSRRNDSEMNIWPLPMEVSSWKIR